MDHTHIGVVFDPFHNTNVDNSQQRTQHEIDKCSFPLFIFCIGAFIVYKNGDTNHKGEARFDDGQNKSFFSGVDFVHVVKIMKRHDQHRKAVKIGRRRDECLWDKYLVD